MENDKITPQPKSINIDTISLFNPVEQNFDINFIVKSSAVNRL